MKPQNYIFKKLLVVALVFFVASFVFGWINVFAATEVPPVAITSGGDIVFNLADTGCPASAPQGNGSVYANISTPPLGASDPGNVINTNFFFLNNSPFTQSVSLETFVSGGFDTYPAWNASGPNDVYVAFACPTISGPGTTDYYMHFIREADGTWNNNPDTTTRVIAVNSPTENATTTTAVGWDIEFFSGTPVNPILFYLTFTNRLTGETINSATSSVAIGYNNFVGTTTVPSEGPYQMSIWTWDAVDAQGNVLAATQYSADSVLFNVGNLTYTDIYGIPTLDPTDLLSLATSTCSISNISGCFQNALVFAFNPSASSTDRMRGLWSLISSKPPVGYFYAVKNAFGTISTTSATTTAVSIPQGIKDQIFTPMNLGITSLLGFIYLARLYKRLKTLDIL